MSVCISDITTAGRTITFHYKNGVEERLDKILLAAVMAIPLEGVTRSQLKNWIEAGVVTVNGKIISKAGTVVASKGTIQCTLPAVSSAELAPFAVELNILFEDDDILVIDKPAKLSMHPGAGNRTTTLMNALVHRYAGTVSGVFFSSTVRAGIVHRLDRDTTGVVVVAKNNFSQQALAPQFAKRTVGRRYQALVLAMPRALKLINIHEEGEIETRIGRDSRNRKKMAVVREGGRIAHTFWKVVQRMPYAALVEVRLATGRTHQIRVHMTSIGAPILGDQVYGSWHMLPKELQRACQHLGRQALHAKSVEFDHPRMNRRMTFESPLPADFCEIMRTFQTYTPQGRRDV